MAVISNPLGNTVLTTGIFVPVRVASTGAALNPSAGGLLVVDGIQLEPGDRVLCKDETSAVNNGIYAVSTGPWQRASDAVSNAQFGAGMAVNVALGAVNAGQSFMCTCTDDPVVIGTSLLTFGSQSSVMSGQQQATSTTSLTVSVGSKTLAIQSGKAFQANQAVLIFETSAPTNCMYGTVTSYSGGSLVVNVTVINGSGTHTDWTVVLFGSAAAAGIAPPLGSGNTTGAGSSTAGHLAGFADATGKVLEDLGPAGALANLSTVAAAQLANSALGFGDGMINGTLAESHSGNAVTFAIKTLAGADPSAGDPVYVIFRDATSGLPALGSFAVIMLTTATSFTFSSGSSAGATNGNPFRIWLVGVNDGGTFRLGAINCSTPTQIYPLNETALVTTVAEGGAGAAKSAGTIYTGTQATSKAMRILGYAEYGSGLATAGTWNASPSAVQLFGPGVKKPGDRVQLVEVSTSTPTSVSSTTKVATGLAASISPTSPVNLVKVTAFGQLQCPFGSNNLAYCQLYRNSGATALGNISSLLTGATAGNAVGTANFALDAPQTTSATQYGLYIDNAAGSSTNTFLGATLASTPTNTGVMTLEEIMG